MNGKHIDSGKKAGNNILKQGTILAAASVISRIIGMLYRSPLTAIIGDDANGLYSAAYEIYSLALILSSYSMPLAVSKLLSARFATKEYRNGYKIFQGAMLFALAAGFIMMALIFFGAKTIENLYKFDGLYLPLRVLAPTIFIVAVVGTLRGFFQSRKTMIPTSVSQLIEQIFNAVVSIAAAFVFVRFAQTDAQYARYGAAGSTMGTLFGALSGLFFLIFLFVIYRPRMNRMLRRDRTGVTLNNASVAKLLAVTIVPIILSQAVYQSVGVVDGFLFGNLYGGEDRQFLYGLYSAKYRTMINIPNAVSSSLASSMIPALVSFYALGNMKEFKDRLASSVKFNMIIAFPCAAGLAVLAWQIMYLLFPTTDTQISGNMLFCGAAAVIFYALSTITNAALQGLDKMRLPVIHAAVALAVHIVILIPLVKFTALGGYALVAGNILYPLVVCVLNWFSVKKYADYRQEIKKTFLIPAISAGAMGIVIFGFGKLLGLILPQNYFGNLITVAVCIVAAAAIYFALIIYLGALTKEDMPDFPMGMRLYRVAVKLRLMR